MDQMTVQQSKTKIATVWLGGCSGCHMSFLDLDERLIDLAPRIELCYSPIMDTKVFPEVDVTLVEGAITNEEHVHEIEEIRKKTKVLIAFGDCAVTGNVTAIRNLYPVSALLERAYVETADPVTGPPPGQEGGIVPRLLERAYPLHEIVPVDVYLPGCPPSAQKIFDTVAALLDGNAEAGAAIEKRFG